MKQELHDIIFEAETKAGRSFDIILITSIVVSVVIVMLDSVAHFNALYGDIFYALEWGLTGIFTLEYLLRLFLVNTPRKYALSFFGIIDLLALLPTYLSLFIPGSQFLLVIRLLRVLRIFRILKLVQFVQESRVLILGLRNSARKIFVFIFCVIILVTILGSLIYFIEEGEHGFTSIPKSIYWAIVTLTTVGYGDITPVSNMGQFLAAIIMLLGYGIIAVPAGIVSSELTQTLSISTHVCPNCTREGHDSDAKHCKFCGTRL